MNKETLITIVVLIIIIALSVRKMIKNKKEGKCSCGCDTCPNSDFCKHKTVKEKNQNS